MALNDTFQRLLSESKTKIDLSPMIDMLFLLLLFFMITTTFDQNEAIVINKAEAKSARMIEKKKIKVLLDLEGNYWLEDKKYEIPDLINAITAWNAENPEGILMVVPDKEGKMEPFIHLIDELYLNEISNFAIGTKIKQPAQGVK